MELGALISSIPCGLIRQLLGCWNEPVICAEPRVSGTDPYFHLSLFGVIEERRMLMCIKVLPVSVVVDISSAEPLGYYWLTRRFSFLCWLTQ